MTHIHLDNGNNFKWNKIVTIEHSRILVYMNCRKKKWKYTKVSFNKQTNKKNRQKFVSCITEKIKLVLVLCFSANDWHSNFKLSKTKSSIYSIFYHLISLLPYSCRIFFSPKRINSISIQSKWNASWNLS